MKYFLFLILFGFTNLFAQGGNVFSIKYNNLGDIINSEMFKDSIYIFGTVTPIDAELVINNKNIKVHSKGGFIAYVKVNITNEKNNDGLYKAIITAKLSKNNKNEKIENIIWVKPPLKTMEFTGTPKINETTIEPVIDYACLPGEQIDVEFFGTPNCSAFFAVEGINKLFPMVETPFVNSYYWGDGSFGQGFVTKGDTIGGYYKGCFFVDENLTNARIKVYLKYKKNGNNFIESTGLAKGKVTSLTINDYQIGVVKKDPNLTIGRSGAGLGYVIFLQEGIKLNIIGWEGDFYKAKLSNDKFVYVEKTSVDIMPKGTPPVKNSVEIIRTENTGDFTEVQLGFFERVPVEIRQCNNPQKYELYFYNTSVNIDWIRFDPKDTLVSEIRHYQEKEGVIKVEVFLSQKAHWGYYAEYDGTIFKLKIKHPAKKMENPLAGRKIVIDPGHNPESGAAGPYGTVEKTINYTLSIVLKKMLEKEGAIVNLTRPNVEDKLNLRERREKVNSFRPDISISMHNNAVPQYMDASIYNGYSSYYYYPQGYPLAKRINTQFSRNFSFRNHGLYCNNLYMCRITEAIAVLVEPFFIIDPEQETMLISVEDQNKVAKSITSALQEFFKEYSE
ncbi:MAG: N-acetylmuramoyl-L-alanine amidase [bacterium]